MIPILKAGCKAYYDTFNGLIDCEVIKIEGNKVKFKLTETVAAYKKGEVLESSTLWVVPTKAIKRRQYSTTIGCYNVQQG
jgi:hypothetical protein